MAAEWPAKAQHAVTRPRRLNDIVAFGLEPLCNSLASSEGDQAREYYPAARLASIMNRLTPRVCILLSSTLHSLRLSPIDFGTDEEGS